MIWSINFILLISRLMVILYHYHPLSIALFPITFRLLLLLPSNVLKIWGQNNYFMIYFFCGCWEQSHLMKTSHFSHFTSDLQLNKRHSSNPIVINIANQGPQTDSICSCLQLTSSLKVSIKLLPLSSTTLIDGC